MQMSTEELPGRRVSLVRVDGDVDDAAAEQLRRSLAETIADGCRTLYLDLSAAPTITEQGLRELLRAARTMRENHGAFHLVGPQPVVRGHLRTSTLDRVLLVHDSLDAVPANPDDARHATVPAPAPPPQRRRSPARSRRKAT